MKVRIKKWWKGLVLLACGLAYAAAVIWVVIPMVSEDPDTYGGLLVFESEDSLAGFKQELKSGVVSGDIELDEYMEVSSELPIIVDFKIQVPRDYVFSYGEVRPRHDVLDIGVGAFLFALLLLVVPTWCLWYPGNESS